MSKLRNPLLGDEVRLLADIGFLGAGLGGLRHAALQLFEGLVTLRPLRDFGYVGTALVHLNNGNVQQALRGLETARAMLDAEPQAQDADRAMLCAFHALALHCAQRNAESQKLFQQVLNLPGNPEATALAQRMLGHKHDVLCTPSLEETV